MLCLLSAGLLLVQQRRYDEAVACWHETLEEAPDYAPAHRLLGVYARNKQHDSVRAMARLQQAVALEPENARFRFELDYLSKLTGTSVSERLRHLEENLAVALKRDDLTAELLSLWNSCGRYADAAHILRTRVSSLGRRGG